MKALLLENIHDVARDALTSAGFEVETRSGALDETELISALEGVDLLGIRSKTKRVISQFSPHDWTTFKWEGTASFGHYFTVVLLLAVFLAAELNPFYLKVGGVPSTA